MSERPSDGPARGRRAAGSNPPGRFERLNLEPLAEGPGSDPRRTRYLRDTSRSIISHNRSPDVRFDAILNPYRGCEVGCIYCFARPMHEYLGFSVGLDFESRILVKRDAPRLLRRELSSPRWVPRALLVSGVTDPYQPVERRLRLTRRCLRVLADFGNPVAVITKSTLVTRDIDVLKRLASLRAACVTVSVTTLRGDLHLAMEPRAAAPNRRLATMRRLAEAGIPVSVNVAPVIPGLTEHELPAILEAAAAAGATGAAFIPLRLPHGVAGLFEGWLAQHFPDRKAKVLNRIRSMRGGRLNDPRFGHRMRGEGPYAEAIRQTFHIHCRRLGLRYGPPELSVDSFRRAERRPADAAQVDLFA